MAVPSDREARIYYRAAQARLAEAETLKRAGHPTGSVYLAGYAIECSLKALILSGTPVGQRATTLTDFRGQRAHDIGWLLRRLLSAGTAPPPANLAGDFALLQEEWSTDLRYSPARMDSATSSAVLASCRTLFQWADQRLT